MSGLTLEHFFRLMGLFLALVAVGIARNPAHPRRWGSASFWLLLAVAIGAGKSLPAEFVGWMVLALGGLVAAKQVVAPTFASEGAALEAAWAIFLFIIPTTVIFHPVWADASQMIQFNKNLAIMGGMLYVAFMGPGKLSLDKA